MLIKKAAVVVVAVTAALSVLPSMAGASTLPAFPAAWALPIVGPNSGNVGGVTGPCGTAVSGGQGPSGNTPVQVCQGGGLSFVGPDIGQIATVIGPTIISPAVVGNQIVTSAGNVAAG